MNDSSSTDFKTHPLVRFAVGRRVTMTMGLVGVGVLGALALGRLPLEFLPSISSSSMWVTVPYSSSSPDEVSRQIIEPLEDSFGTLNGLDRMSSQASANNGSVSLEFVDGTDMDLAAVEVRDRIDRVRHLLPADVRQVRVRRFQSTDIPVLRLQMSAPWQASDLYNFAEQVLQRHLERLEGVAQVDIDGLRQQEVQVQLQADRLAAHGIDTREVVRLLQENHLNLSAGHIIEGSRKLLVRCVGELKSLEEIRSLPLRQDLKLGDLARVAYAFPEQESYSFLNGKESMSVKVYKASSANLLQVVRRVKAELADLEASPAAEGVSFRIYHDSSQDVLQGLGQLRDAGFVGGGLAILAVFVFLRRWRTTLLVGIAIPVSVVFTFVLMFLLRQAGWAQITLNVVSLMGLVLALGMLLDNSIVVIESIYRRMEELGEDAPTAALRGASEVALPITAATATTLCVFIPMIFLGGGGGFFARYMEEIGLTVCIVLVASLLVALTVVPMAAALLLNQERPQRTPFFDWLGDKYVSILRFTLRHRLVFLALSAAVLYGSWWLIASIERTSSARTEERRVTINVDTDRGFSLDQTQAVFDEIDALLAENRDALDIADVSYDYHTGGGRSRGWGREKRFEIFLKDESEGSLSTTEARDRIRDLLPQGRAGVALTIAQSTGRHGSQGLELEISGDDPQVLESIGREIAGKIAYIPTLQDVDLSLESGDDEVRVDVQRERAVQAGVSSRTVAQTIQSSLTDRALSYIKTEDRDVDLIVRYRDEDRETLNQLRTVSVATGDSRQPLDALAAFSVQPGPRSIDRENRQPKITITANPTNPRAMFGAMAGVRQLMAQQTMPPGYTWSFGRWNRMGEQDQKSSFFALLFASVLVYLLMAALFESFSHPFSIMCSIPFAFIGVGAVMKLTGQPRDSFTDLGFIILIGVVVNNAIVLVDHINRLRQEGTDRVQAILIGGRHRLRAILMTAVTTILGLLPMVAPLLLPQFFGPLEGRSATWVPTALVILGGLTTSTFLTLLITPTLYSAVSDSARWIRRVARTA